MQACPLPSLNEKQVNIRVKNMIHKVITEQMIEILTIYRINPKLIDPGSLEILELYENKIVNFITHYILNPDNRY